MSGSVSKKLQRKALIRSHTSAVKRSSSDGKIKKLVVYVTCGTLMGVVFA